jgi:Phage tail tube protein, TTP/Ubiquitin-activating enzyme E1 FCCH domain
MSNVKGRGVRVEIAATYSAPETITAITKANPGVCTSTAHGLTNDTVGYFSGVTGMVQLEGQACRIKNVTANTFELQGLDTTSFSDFTAGTFVPVATWNTMSESTRYGIGGGAGNKLNATRLIDIIDQEEQGNLPAGTFTVGLLAQDTPSAAMTTIENAVQNQSAAVVRVTFSNGAVRVLRGEPSLPGEEVDQGQLGTGTLDFAVKGRVLKLAA